MFMMKTDTSDWSLVPVELLEIERQLDARLRVFYHLEQLDNGVTPGWYICLKDFNALPKKDLVIGKYIDNNENPYSDNMFALDSESKPLDFPSSINDITQNLGPTMEGLRDTLDEAPKDQPCEAPKQRLTYTASTYTVIVYQNSQAITPRCDFVMTTTLVTTIDRTSDNGSGVSSGGGDGDIDDDNNGSSAGSDDNAKCDNEINVGSGDNDYDCNSDNVSDNDISSVSDGGVNDHA
ncbi:hypothetical protein JHK86_015900 [Glycine max]|nr:hypothetical protein JHK86_015900 [Glycine max]